MDRELIVKNTLQQFLEIVGNFLQFPRFMIPQVNGIGIARFLSIGQEHELVAATVITDSKGVWRKSAPVFGRGGFPDDVVARPRQSFSVAAIQDWIQRKCVLADINLTAVVDAHSGNIIGRQRTAEFRLGLLHKPYVEWKRHLLFTVSKKTRSRPTVCGKADAANRSRRARQFRRVSAEVLAYFELHTVDLGQEPGCGRPKVYGVRFRATQVD